MQKCSGRGWCAEIWWEGLVCRNVVGGVGVQLCGGRGWHDSSLIEGLRTRVV